MRAYKSRLYPSRKLEEKLLRTLELCRFVYNWALEGLNEREKPNLYGLKRRLPKLKAGRPELKEVYSQVLQNEVIKLYDNLKTLAALSLCPLRFFGLAIRVTKYFRLTKIFDRLVNSYDILFFGSFALLKIYL